MTFAHLHNHSDYSLLQGAIRIKDLVGRAKAYGMKSVALTDYGNLFGAIEFYTECKTQGIKPIIGAVLYHPSNNQRKLRTHRRGIDHLFELLVLITNKKGYLNLCEIITQSYLDGFYYKPRIDTELLTGKTEGLIAFSGGWDGAVSRYLVMGDEECAREAAQTYQNLFPNQFYMELHENGIEGQHETNQKLIQLAKEENIPLVATNNCHYLNQDDAEAFEALLCIQTGATLHGGSDHLKYSTNGYYFKTTEEMHEAFSYVPIALESIPRIIDQVDFSFDLKSYYFPKFTPPVDKSLDDYLEEQAREGLEKRWPALIKKEDEATLKIKYLKRLEVELTMIRKMGFSSYFLIVSDFIRYAKSRGIPVGPGRGSAAGSLVAFCIEITDIDPLPYKLLFERFLNPERVTMPDVDIDFCMNRRNEVLDYVNQKYGNVSQIITFGKMKAKAVIRDVGRVLEIPYAEVDRIAKLVPNSLNITLDQALKEEPRFKEISDQNPQVERLLEIAHKLEGLNRHASTHAAGVVISDRKLTEFLPLYKGSNNDIVTQFDMKAVEKIGLIKFDFLGLKTLTVIQDAIKIIRRTKSHELHILDIDVSDPKVYELLSRGNTPGIFQLESSGMKDLLTRLKPNCFEDLIAVLALYRPGPLGSGMVDDFINRKQGKVPIIYDVSQLKSILEDTYGIIVYQEQVMQIASVLAGYSLGEADLLRRAMGKKKPGEMAAQRIRFLQGCEKNKIHKEKAEKIFDLMAKFAEYGFNKSHSAAYALVTYQTAHLKNYYPVEYMAAILSSEMQDTDKIQYYIHDCQSHGIKVAKPHVNESFFGFSVIDDRTIHYGLGALKNVGEGAIVSIIESRKKDGPFKSFFDFCIRIDHRKVNKRVIESLIKSGAFDEIEKTRSGIFQSLELAVDTALKLQKEKSIGQSNLFEFIAIQNHETPHLNYPDIPEWMENEKLTYEKESIGFYFSGHPLKVFENEVRKISTAHSTLLPHLANQTEVILVGMTTKVKIITTKKGKRMAFVTLEDLSGLVEIIVFSDLFQKNPDLFSQEYPIVIKGVLDRSEEGVKIIAKEANLLTAILQTKTRSIHFTIPVAHLTNDRLQHFHKILGEYPGPFKGYVHVIDEGCSETVMELPTSLGLSEREALFTKVNRIFQKEVSSLKF